MLLISYPIFGMSTFSLWSLTLPLIRFAFLRESVLSESKKYSAVVVVCLSSAWVAPLNLPPFVAWKDTADSWACCLSQSPCLALNRCVCWQHTMWLPRDISLLSIVAAVLAEMAPSCTTSDKTPARAHQLLLHTLSSKCCVLIRGTPALSLLADTFLQLTDQQKTDQKASQKQTDLQLDRFLVTQIRSKMRCCLASNLGAQTLSDVVILEDDVCCCPKVSWSSS